MTYDTKLLVPISSEVRQKLRQRVQQHGVSMSQVIRALIDAWLAEEVTVDIGIGRDDRTELARALWGES